MGKESEIAGLLSQGIPPSELVRKGLTRSTVYKVAKRLQERTPEQPGTAQGDTDGAKAVTGYDLDPALEADPEIVELRKSIRKAELEQQLADLKAPTRFEPRLLMLEKTVGEMAEAVTGLINDLDEVEQQVEGSPLSGLRKKFRCSCGQTGLVAASVVCTSCGAQTTYGSAASCDTL